MDHIYINNLKLTKITKSGRKNIYLLEDGSTVEKNDIFIIETECPICKKRKPLANLHSYNMKKATVCFICGSKGENNPFYGKKHSQETISKWSALKKNKYNGKNNPMYGKTVYQRWVELYGEEGAEVFKEKRNKKLSILNKGENNSFYGKKHSQETIKKIISKNKIWRSNLTQEEKDIISQKLSVSQKRLQEKDPAGYRLKRQRAGQVSLQNKEKYKINKIEKIIQNLLIDKQLDFEYSLIIGKFQFDFGNKESRILLEVQGDYWHGNPGIYKDFNSIQLSNQKKDILKKDFAMKHGFKLFYIWEKDIKNNNFSIIEEIENEIRINRD